MRAVETGGAHLPSQRPTSPGRDELPRGHVDVEARAAGGPGPRHAAAARQASPSVQCSRLKITGLCSAAGQVRQLVRFPAGGPFQRSRASTQAILPSRAPTIGW